MPEDAPVQDIDPMLDDTADQLIEAMRQRHMEGDDKFQSNTKS